jgi:hypothetical protein
MKWYVQQHSCGMIGRFAEIKCAAGAVASVCKFNLKQAVIDP